MADFRVLIKGLDFYAYHGCSSEEKRLGHRYLISVELWVNGQAHLTDSVEDTVNYVEISAAIVQLASESQCTLEEFLAKEICDELLAMYPTIERIDIEVLKPLPPMPVIMEAVGVRYTAIRS